MGNEQVDERHDDEVYCTQCREALRYDRETKTWRTKYLEEDANMIRKCFDNRMGKWDHQPRGNVGRLVRVAKKINDRKKMGL